MTHRQIKSGYFALTAVNTIASSYYFNYLFFFLRDRFGFGDRENLRVSAMYGFLYIFSAWQCGRFAQRRGFINSLKIGFGGLTVMMIIGGCTNTLPATLGVLVGYSIVLLFTWPALEALVSENETRAGVQHMVGIYNCTWSGAAALAYFTGGPLYDRLGRGAVFWLPAILFSGQFIFLHWLSLRAGTVVKPPEKSVTDPRPHPEAAAPRQPASPAGFLKMAWLANPFAYVAMYTLLAVMPGIAHKLELSPTKVGLCCSIWLFARLGAFAGLWHWSGWHYRFRWLFLSFVTLIVSFLFLLLAHQLWVFVLAQIFFGLAAGLIYYSSL